MSDQVIGTCCALALTACVDVLTGACTDFMSMRHPCTETLCRCPCLGCCKTDPLVDDFAQEERDPLLSHTQQPPSHPPMRTTDAK